jgi:hypothetical protein
MTAFVLDVVETKFVVVVSKRFKVSEPFHSATLLETFHFYLNRDITAQFFSQIVFGIF